MPSRPVGSVADIVLGRPDRCVVFKSSISSFFFSNDSVDCAMCKNTYHMNCVQPPLQKNRLGVLLGHVGHVVESKSESWKPGTLHWLVTRLLTVKTKSS